MAWYDFLTDIGGTGYNIFGAGPSENTKIMQEMGLLGADAVKKAQQKSLLQGLLTTGLSYAAQPKTGGYGSAIPYLAKAGLAGVQAAQSPYDQLTQDAIMQQKFEDIQRDKTQREKRKQLIENLRASGKYDDLTMAAIETAPEQTLVGLATKDTKPLSIDDQMDQIIFDITAKEKRGEPLTITDKANLQAAQKVKLAGSSDPTGYQATLQLGAEKGREAQAKDFGKIANEWIVGNKAADANALIQNLEEVKTMLESSDDITGGFIGALPTGVRERVYPKSIEAQERVESVIQRGLRETLGAQFTEKEGERLIKRAYNPNLSEEENLKRVNRLLATMKIAIQKKNDAVAYYNEKGTLAGYDYTPITIKDFEDVLPETSVGKVDDKKIQELQLQFPKPEGMSDDEYQLILRNL